MKRFFSLLIVCLLTSVSLQAVPAHKGKVTVKQPDGTTVTLRLHGDEYLHFTTTDDGYTVVRDADNFYRYARMEQGELQSTGIVAHDLSQRTADEQVYLDQATRFLSPEMRTDMQQMAERNHSAQHKALARRKAGQYDYSKFRGLLILVQFNDKEFSRTDYKDIITNMVNQSNYTGYTGTNGRKVTFTGSVRDYFYDNSAGKFSPQFDVYGPVTINYSQYDANGANNAWSLVNAAVNAVDADVNFKNYDRDGDGYVDLIYFIFAGNGANYGGNDSRLFWPHRSGFYGYVSKDGVRLGDYASSVELYGYTSYPSTVTIDGIGTICHEFSHVLGLPDFYDTDYESNGQSNDPGDWSVMAGGSYFNNGRTPVGYSLFERYAVGFTDNPTVIKGEGSYRLESIDQVNTGYRLNTSVRNESFFLENRQRTKWNAYLPGAGMLVFRVDSTSAQVWSRNTVNANPTHNYYELVRANGYRGNASASDPFPGTENKTELNNSTSPANLLPWNDGGTQWGLLNIRHNNGVITFDVEDAYVLKALEMDESITVGVGISRTLEVTPVPNYIEVDLEWTSSDPRIATVEGGKVKGISAGTCVVTAKAKGTDIEATCQVNVEEQLIVSSIAEFKSLEEGTEAILQLKDANVLYIHGKNTYINDASGAIILKDINTYKRWDKLNGNVYGRLTSSNKMPMFEAVEGLTSLNDIDVKAGSEFNGQDIQLENLTESNYADYFVVKQVELVIDGGMYAVKGDKRARLYNTLGAKNIKVPTSIEDKRFDITCIYGTNTLNGETIDELYLLKSPEEVDWTPELEALVLTDKLPLTVGTTKAISVTATPAKAAYTLTWTSDNEEVATVDEDGNVTAVACGTSIITATADNGVKASTAVIVTAADMVDNLASVLSLSEGDLVGISLTDGHVLYVDGSNIYLRDASAAAVLNVTAITPEQSDVINGEVYLQLTHVNRMPVLLPVEGWATAADFIVGQGDEQEPREVAADDLSEGDYADYVILKAVPITLDTYYYTGSETDQLRLFNTFNIADVTLPEEYEQRLFDVEGIYGTNTLNGEIINELYLLKSPLKVQDIPDGIDIVSFDALKNEPAYNLAGQQVSASYKGIVVVAGKKIVRK